MASVDMPVAAGTRSTGTELVRKHLSGDKVSAK